MNNRLQMLMQDTVLRKAFGSRVKEMRKNRHCANLYRRFQTLEALSDEDRTTVISVIDAIIAKRQVENAIKPVDQQASG